MALNVKATKTYLPFADITVKKLQKGSQLIAKRVEFGPMSKEHRSKDKYVTPISAIETSFDKNQKVKYVRVRDMLGNWSPKNTPDVFTNPKKEFSMCRSKFQSKILKENAIDIMAPIINAMQGLKR